MDTHAWLQTYRCRVDETGARAVRTRSELREVAATATSRDGAVSVTVDPGGALHRLVLGERAAGLSRAQLAAAVLATAGQAHELARRRADEIATAFLGGAAVSESASSTQRRPGSLGPATVAPGEAVR